MSCQAVRCVLVQAPLDRALLQGMQPALRWLRPGTASAAAMLLTGAPNRYSGHLPVTQQHMGISLRTFTRSSRASDAGSLLQRFSAFLGDLYHHFSQTSPEPGSLDQQLHRNESEPSGSPARTKETSERRGQSLDSDMMDRQCGSHARRVSERQSQNESELYVLACSINRSKALAANFKQSSELYDRVWRLMLEAAADSSTYTDARTCQQVANSQVLLRLPCEEFWCNLLSKGVPCPGDSPQQASALEGNPEHLPEDVRWVDFSCSLLRQRISLATHGLMPRLSSDLYTELLRAICKAIDRHQKVDSETLRGAFQVLVDMSNAASEGLIPDKRGSPFKDLEAKVALKLLSLLEDDIPASCDISVIWWVIHVLDLAAQLGPKALETLDNALVHQVPVMSSQQLTWVACELSEIGMLSSSKGSAALLSAVAHALPKMGKGELGRLGHCFRKAARMIKAEAWVPFLDALPGVAAKLTPRGVSEVIQIIGSFPKAFNTFPDKHTINALLTALPRKVGGIQSGQLFHLMMAFEKIPLPFDSPAGHALLAELPRGIKGVSEKFLTRWMDGLVSAEVAIPEKLMDALWTELERVAAFLTVEQLLNVLGNTAVLKNRGVIPEEVRTVLLRAVLRRAPLIDRRTAQEMFKWLRVLGWEIPDELFDKL